ncbi:MAG: hypothetical protein ACRDAL_02465 [Plesiomonas shigelloides]
MGQFKYGDAVKVVIEKGNPCYEQLNGLAGTYTGKLPFPGHSVFIPKLGNIIVRDVEPIGKTLLEILVDELPKRGGWRDGASVCIQDSCKAIKFNSRHSTLTMNEFGNWESKPDAFNNYGWVGANLLGVSDLATDHATKIVTREEYEQAVKPTRFEQSVKAANELALVMLENMAQRLTDACSQRDDDVNDTGETITLHYPAGYHIPEDLRIPEGYDVKSTTISEEPSEPSKYLVAAHGKAFAVEVDCTLGTLPVPTSKSEALNNMLKKNGISDDEAVKACAEAETAELKVKKRIENFSKESAPWCILPDFLRGIFEASAQPDENESKIERIERLHDAFKSAKAALDAEFKPIIEIMDDLELGDYFTVNHNKDGLVNFRVTKVISELDGQDKERKLFVTKLSTGDEYALTKKDKSYAVKVS